MGYFGFHENIYLTFFEEYEEPKNSFEVDLLLCPVKKFTNRIGPK